MAAWYDDYLKSVHWQKTRLRRLIAAELDNEFNVIRCQDEACRMWFPLGLIEIHHNTYERLGKELMKDLDVLCFACHGHRHGHRRPLWWEESKHGGSLMVTLQTVKAWGGIKHIGTVMEKCLAYHNGFIPKDLANTI